MDVSIKTKHNPGDVVYYISWLHKPIKSKINYIKIIADKKETRYYYHVQSYPLKHGIFGWLRDDDIYVNKEECKREINK